MNNLEKYQKELAKYLLKCVEPKVDWSKVAVDTPILVRNFESDLWIRRYFAKYENGKIYAWADGRTSWSVNESNDIIDWSFAKLAAKRLMITSENRIRTFAVNKKGEIVDCHGDPENTSFEFGPCRNCIFKDSRTYGCKKARMNWLMEEHEEPEEIDWSKVSVGTPILVKRGAGDRCFTQYFKEYKNEKISTWDDPERTHECILDWAPEFAKLAEE